MKHTTLDARLLSAAEFVRQGAVLADIGTDHAYLPIFLLKSGRIERAVLSDVNEGPLASAARNAEAEGVSGRVATVLTDGATALHGMGITDYTICGMGGELIARIIEDAPHLCDPSLRLILQPMTRQATLRRLLARLGFSIRSEKYSFADGKYYVCILAEFTGQISETDPISAELGTEPTDGGRVEYIGYLEAKLGAAERAYSGKRAGGNDAAYEEKLIGALTERIKKLKEGIAL